MIAYALIVSLLAYANSLQVNTTEGIVEGSKAPDGDYYTFYNIPYAGPPSGHNRFKGPVPPLNHSGVFYANNSNVICAQPTAQYLIGVENCLTLSIFTKNVTTSSISRPVFVWLSTEEYTTSYSQKFSFRRFVEENIVFVTMNFRLSIFGFLCLGVPEAPGNAGLKDVIQGLKWIKFNIANFGGNPNNVVLMGHAAGAAMVDLLTLSRQIQTRLVHKAIALSGSGLAPWAVTYNPIGYAELLATKIGYKGKTIKDLAKFFVKTDTDVFQHALNDLKFRNHTPIFAPCIENPKLKMDDTVISEAPIKVLKAAVYPQIPFIYGYTSNEGTMRIKNAVTEKWEDDLPKKFIDLLPVDLLLQVHKNKEGLSEYFSSVFDIRDFYFGSKYNIDNFLHYEGDAEITIPVIRTAKLRALTSMADVRLLNLAYMGTQNSDWIYKNISLTGAKHGAFLNYLFDFDLRPDDEVISRSIVRRFAEFAHNSIPIANVAQNNSVAWPPISLIINNNMTYLSYVNSGFEESNTTIYKETLHHIVYNEEPLSLWIKMYKEYYVTPIPVIPSNSACTSLSCAFFIMLCQMLIYLL